MAEKVRQGENEDTHSKKCLLCFTLYLNAITHLKLFSTVCFPLKSVGAHHSVNASAHSLLQLMRHYGPHVLQKPAEATEPGRLRKPTKTISQCKTVALDSEKSVSICDNLSELLMAMQGELDQMSM